MGMDVSNVWVKNKRVSRNNNVVYSSEVLNKPPLHPQFLGFLIGKMSVIVTYL